MALTIREEPSRRARCGMADGSVVLALRAWGNAGTLVFPI